MTREFLHFIQKNLNEAVEGAIEEVLCSYPSKYVSHTVDTFNVDLTLWHVTALELQNIPLVEGTNYLQVAREKEGMLVLGSGPDMNDGSCRLVYSIIKPSQLSVEPFGAFDTSSLCKNYEALGSYHGLRCLSLGEKRIPHIPDVTFRSSHCYGPQSNATDTIAPGGANNLWFSVYGKMKVKVHSDDDTIPLNEVKVFRPLCRLGDKLLILFHQLKPSFCSCSEDVWVHRVTVVLKEITTCKVPIHDSFGYQQDVREFTLRKEKCNQRIVSCATEGTDDQLIAYLEKSCYDCCLPNLGPTFFSDTMSRTYELHFTVILGCSAVKCFSIFEPSIGINVAVVDHENNDISPGQQTKREGDVFHIVSLPYSSTTVQDFKRSVKERLQGLGLDFSAYHTFSHSTTAGVVTLMTVNLSSMSSLLLIESSLESREEGPYDCKDTIVYSDGCYRMCSSGVISKLFETFQLTFPTSSRLISLAKYQPNVGDIGATFLCENRVAPNKFCTYKLLLSCPERCNLYLHKLSVELVEKTLTMEGLAYKDQERSIPLVCRQFRSLKCKSLDYCGQHKEGFFYDVPKEFTHYTLPMLEPTVITPTFYREYFLVVKVKVSKSFFRCFRIAVVRSVPISADNLLAYLRPPPYEMGKEKSESQRALQKEMRTPSV